MDINKDKKLIHNQPKKTPTWVLWILVICIAVGSLVLFKPVGNNMNPDPYNLSNPPDFNIATNSEIDMYQYYEYACGLTHFVVDQCQLLAKNYPEKYGKIQSKLDEYDLEMATCTEQDCFIKGTYNITYAEELVSLMYEYGFTDEEIEKDYEAIPEIQEFSSKIEVFSAD